MNKKGYVVIVVVVLIGLIAALVSGGYMIYRAYTSHKQIEEELKDFSLDTVTDEEVVEKRVATIYKSHTEYASSSTSGANHMGYGDDVDSDRVREVAESVRGFCVVSASKVVDAKLTINISSEIHAGRGKIAIIKDDSVVEYIEFGTSVTREYEVDGESLFLVKIICEDAKIDITVEREIQKLS